MRCPPRKRARLATDLEVIEILRHNVMPHEAVVNPVATMLVVSTHFTCSCTLVETLVDVLGGKPQLAEALEERLGRSKHRDGQVQPRRAWRGVGGSSAELN